jgi:ABC-2 type transport system ATP-binding protein
LGYVSGAYLSAALETTLIQVHELQKLYDTTLAVAGVTFSLQPGDICGLVGPNGAGKTTTMRCLAGLITPTSGQMSVDGLCVMRDSLEVRKRLAYVPDDPALFDDLTVGQHLDLIAGLYDVRGRREKSEELLALFNLSAKVNELAGSLSRGMRQKLAICCNYLFDPKVLLLDEPLTGLDPPGIRGLLDSIRARAARGACVILSSHLLAMIDHVCTHVLVMQHGRVEFFGTSDALRHRHPEASTLEDAYFAAMTKPASVSSYPVAPIVTGEAFSASVLR